MLSTLWEILIAVTAQEGTGLQDIHVKKRDEEGEGVGLRERREGRYGRGR